MRFAKQRMPFPQNEPHSLQKLHEKPMEFSRTTFDICSSLHFCFVTVHDHAAHHPGDPNRSAMRFVMKRLPLHPRSSELALCETALCTCIPSSHLLLAPITLHRPHPSSRQLTITHLPSIHPSASSFNSHSLMTCSRLPAVVPYHGLPAGNIFLACLLALGAVSKLPPRSPSCR